MSKFIEKLERVLQGGLQPMGFRAAPPVPSKPRMLLVAAAGQVNIGRLANSVAGADAGLLSVTKLSSGAKALQQLSQATPDIPWGGWLKEAGRAEIDGVAEAGADFVVFPAAGTPLAILQDEKLGKILEVEPSLDAGLLRAIDDLPADAVLIAAEGENPLTWHHLMLFQRCANILSKPLLVPVPPDVTERELGALWGAGVSGVVVKAEAEGKITGIRRMLDKLPLPSAGKRKKAEPLLPRISGESGIVSEEEEDEE